jgi:hypothetical protein
MFAVRAWVGVECRAETNFDTLGSTLGSFKLEVFSLFSNRRLGFVFLFKSKAPDLAEAVKTMIKDLQRQAALLLRHAKRGSNHMVLVLDNIKLPSLTYRDDVPIQERFEAFYCLVNATSKSKLFVSWNEDDFEALSLLRSHHELVNHLGMFSLDLKGTYYPELDVLAFLGVTNLRISNVLLGVEYPTFLSRLRLTCLGLINADLSSWDFAKNHRLTTLNLCNCKFNTPTFENLAFLEHIWAFNSELEPSMLRNCTNLQSLSLANFRSDQVAQFRKEMPHVTVIS